MKFISLFDVIGPDMIGPSSSHTAGAVSIALTARKMFGVKPTSVRFILYGSFSKTYKGHGTDRALLGGILGFSTDDIRIRDSFRIAEQTGLKYEFFPDEITETVHPNTVDILLKSDNGAQLSVRGESLGGGKIRISRIDGIEVDFTGEYSTVIISHRDVKGMAAFITQSMTEGNVNIAFMKLYRESRGKEAFTIIEADDLIPESILNRIRENTMVDKVMAVAP